MDRGMYSLEGGEVDFFAQTGAAPDIIKDFKCANNATFL